MAIKYIIAFDKNADDATGTMTSLDAVYDADATLAACAFSRKGYTFAGWNTKADGTGNAYADAATVKNLTIENGATVTLYAQWKQITHTVTFSDPDGNTSTPAQTVNDGATATAPQDPTRDGYAFDGWLLDGEKYDFSKPVTEDITLVAKWSKVTQEGSQNTEQGTDEKPEPPAAPKPAPNAPAAKVPNTSDATMPVYALVALVAGGAALVVMSSRKRNRS